MSGGIDIKILKQRKGTTGSIPISDRIVSILNADIILKSKKLSDKEKESFYLEFYSMLTAGISVKSALEIITEEEKKDKVKEYLKFLDTQLVNGMTLSTAMKRSNIFTPYEIHSIQIGEETGRLNEVIEELANYFTAKIQQRRQLISAMSYPIVIFFTSLLAVGFLLLFLVPMFEDIFTRFGGELPAMTKGVIAFSNGILDHIWLLFIMGIGLIILYLLLKEKNWFKSFMARFIRKIPLFGDIHYGTVMSRFCRSMSLLISSRVPLIQSVELINQIIRYPPINVALEQVSVDLFNGEALHNSLSKQKVFTSKFVTMIKVGEEANQLDVFFNKIASNYSNDVEFKTGQLNTFMEPLLIVFLGLVVGFILVTMYLPMFQISTNLGM